jgi:hypothetical protein
VLPVWYKEGSMRRQLVIWIAAVVALGALLLSVVPVGAA